MLLWYKECLLTLPPVAGVEVAALEAAGPFCSTEPARNPMSSRNHTHRSMWASLVILLGHAFLQHLHLLLLHCHVQTIHIKSHQIKITTFLQKFWVLLIFFVVCRFPLPVPLFYRFFCLLPVKHLCFQSPLLCSDEFPLTFPKTVRLWQEKCKKCMKFENRWLLKPKVQKLRKVGGSWICRCSAGTFGCKLNC